MSDTLLALDIGTEFIKAAIAKTTRKGSLEIIGIGKAEQSGSNMNMGAIANIPAVIDVCEKAIYEAEQEARVTAKQAIVGIAGELIKSNTTSVHYTREKSDKPITEEEMMTIVKKVQQKSGDYAKKEIALETGKDTVEVRLINSAIISLSLDGYTISNPIGFKGSELTIQFYTAFAHLMHVAAIEKVCAELNLDLLAIAVEPFAVSRACLGNNDNSNYSGIVMDIGGGTTDIALITNGGIDGTKMFSLGGRNITKQIAEATEANFKTAEKYKLELDDMKPSLLRDKIESAIDKIIPTWLYGIEIAFNDFENADELPCNILLCGGGAGLTKIQETLALTDWYKELPFQRRPIIELIDPYNLPDIEYKTTKTIDHSFVTALGLLRIGVDTLVSVPEEKGLKAKISKLLSK